MAGLPGEEFVLERLARIKALPPSKRPSDAVRFLEACRLQEEVAAALPLPPMPPAAVSLERVDSDKVSLALLKLLKAYRISSFGIVDVNNCSYRVHNQTVNFFSGPGRVDEPPGPGLQPLINQWDNDSLLTMLRALCVGFTLRQSEGAAVNEPLNSLMDEAVRRLSSLRLAAGYAQELAQLQRSCQPAAPLLLSVEELEYVALSLRYELLPTNDTGAASAARLRVASRMLALAPEPLVYVRLMADSGEHLDKVAWAKRGLDAALARGSDWETAFLAIAGAHLAAQTFQASTSLFSSVHRQQQTRAEATGEAKHLLRLARESLQHIQSLLPTTLIRMTKLELKKAEASCAPLTGKKAPNPSAEAAVDEATQQQCASCQRTASCLKLCSGCRAVAYCSVECQRQHWRQHKPGCMAVRESKAAAPMEK
ncbi:hypothetical protein N2152v2_003241 [Parachlorella kessleri]